MFYAHDKHARNALKRMLRILSMNLSAWKFTNSKSFESLFWVRTGYCVSVNEENVVLITGSCTAKAPSYNKFFSEKFSLTDKHVCEVKETIWISTSFCTKYTHCCKVFFVSVILYFGVLFRASWWRRTRGDNQASQEQLSFKSIISNNVLPILNLSSRFLLSTFVLEDVII
jgi:hypothetical protein